MYSFRKPTINLLQTLYYHKLFVLTSRFTVGGGWEQQASCPDFLGLFGNLPVFLQIFPYSTTRTSVLGFELFTVLLIILGHSTFGSCNDAINGARFQNLQLHEETHKFLYTWIHYTSVEFRDKNFCLNYTRQFDLESDRWHWQSQKQGLFGRGQNQQKPRFKHT